MTRERTSRCNLGTLVPSLRALRDGGQGIERFPGLADSHTQQSAFSCVFRYLIDTVPLYFAGRFAGPGGNRAVQYRVGRCEVPFLLLVVLPGCSSGGSDRALSWTKINPGYGVDADSGGFCPGVDGSRRLA